MKEVHKQLKFIALVLLFVEIKKTVFFVGGRGESLVGNSKGFAQVYIVDKRDIATDVRYVKCFFRTRFLMASSCLLGSRRD